MYKVNSRLKAWQCEKKPSGIPRSRYGYLTSEYHLRSKLYSFESFQSDLWHYLTKTICVLLAFALLLILDMANIEDAPSVDTNFEIFFSSN